MTRYQYYQEMKRLARQIRAENDLSTPRVLRSDLRRIYKTYGIKIDLWPYKLKNLRGAIISDDRGTSVMLAKSLPTEPLIFTMGHELKHYLVDKHLEISYCDQSNESEQIEIGAEIFSAELIFPDSDFEEWMNQNSIKLGQCTPETIVKLKIETQTTLSYTSLSKKATYLNFAPKGAFQKIKWSHLAEQLYGKPSFGRRW